MSVPFRQWVSLAYIQNHGIRTMEKLKAACADAAEQYLQAKSALQETQRQLKELNEQIHYLGAYLATKNTYSEFLKHRIRPRSAQRTERTYAGMNRSELS